MKRIIFNVAVIASLFSIVSCVSCSKNNSESDEEEKPLHVQTDKLPEKEKEEIRIVSYNVGAFSKYVDGTYTVLKNIATVSNMMKEIDADVIVMNEVDYKTTRTGKIDELGTFATEFGASDHVFSKALDYGGGEYGNGLVSKKKAIKKYTIQLAKGLGKEVRSLVVAEFDKYVVAGTHLDYASDEAQIEQIKIINNFIEQNFGDSNKAIFLLGDLNATPESQSITYLKEKWESITPTNIVTFPSTAPIKCIDYILKYKNNVSCETKNAAVLNYFESGDVRKTSDHLPVMADIKL